MFKFISWPFLELSLYIISNVTCSKGQLQVLRAETVMLNSRPTLMPYKNIDLRARSVQIMILKKRPLYKSVVSPTRDLWFEGFLAKASWDAVSPCCSSREGGRPKNYCSQWEMLPKYYIERFANNFGQFWLTMRDALKILHWKISQQCWTILVHNERCSPNNRGEFPDMLNM